MFQLYNSPKSVNPWRSLVALLVLMAALAMHSSVYAQRTSATGGTFTIDKTGTNTGTNFVSFNDAIADINLVGTFTGTVTFNVVAGQTFNGPDTLPVAITATGTGATARIIFQKSGTGANPVITPVGTTGALDFGISIAGGDWISFNGIDITATTTAVEYGILVKNGSATNGANFNTFSNGTILLDRTISSTRGVMQSSSASYGGAATATAAVGLNYGNRYDNLTIGNSNSGFWIYGASSALLDSGTVINNCKVGRASVPNDIGGNLTNVVYGIYPYYQNYASITNNTVTNMRNQSTMYVLYGTYLNNSKVNYNTFTNNNNNTTFYNIYLSTTTADSICYNTITNNNSGGGTFYGIYLPTAGTNTRVIGNVQANNILGTHYHTYLSSSTTAIIANNRSYNNTITGTTYGWYLSTSNGAIINNNVIENSTLSGAYYNVYCVTPTNITISNNRATNVAAGSTTYGVYCTNLTGTIGNLIFGNEINNVGNAAAATAGTVYGMSFTNVATSNTFNKIYNNVIANLYNNYQTATATTTKYLYGMYFGTAANTTASTVANYEIYYNTVSINQGSGLSLNYSSATMYFTPTANTVLVPIYNIRNNHFENLTGAQTGVAKHYVMWSSSSGGNYLGNASTVCNYNNYYLSATTNGFMGYVNASDKADLAAWVLALTAFDGNSLSLAPNFNTSSVLKPFYGSPLVVAGTPISGYSQDMLGVTRNALNPTIGAYEKAGDFIVPTLTYVPLLNAYSLTNRTTVNFATIQDNVMLNTTSGTAPRFYYKKSSNSNTFGANTSATNGWKWVESASGVSPFNFTIDYSLLTGGSVAVGDTIQYFVIAQDTPIVANVTANPSAGFVGTSVANITSAPAPNYYVIAGSSPVLPIVTKTTASGIGAFKANVGGTIVSDGGSIITASGVVYATTPNPARLGPGVVDSTTTPLVIAGPFQFTIQGLLPGTKYYYRSYALNGIGLVYSAQDSFTTNPVVNYFPYAQNFDTIAVNTGWTSAPVNGAINEWVLGTPAKTFINAAYSGTRSWVTGLTGIYSNTQDAAVTSPQMDFSASAVTPLLRFKHKFQTETGWDALVVEVSVNGGAWTKVDNTLGTGTNYNTTLSTTWYNSSSTSGPITPSKFSGVNSGSIYSSQVGGWITSLTPLTGTSGQSDVRVRFRFGSDGSGQDEGWALDDIEVFYPSAPIVRTGTKSNITTNSVTVNGQIISDGGNGVTASGMVVGTSPNPTRGTVGVTDSATAPTVTTGSFSVNVAGLFSATTYYYRSYAVNAIGTSYGPDSTFTTNASAIAPSVTRIAATNITAYAARIGGNITSDGGAPVIMSGVVYATTPNPAIGGMGVVDSTTSPAVTMGTYYVNPVGLNHSTKYYFRAYAANYVGITYSNQDSFNTAPVISTLPYLQNFDTPAVNTGWTSVPVTGTVNDWVLGTPAKTYLNAAYSGTRAWVTTLTGIYNNNVDAAVVSPQMDFTLYPATPLVRFKHKFQTETGWDALIVEISINGGAWTKLDNTLGTGGNFNTPSSTAWYNSNSTYGPITPNKFSGANSASIYSSQASGWITSLTPLTGAAGQSNVRVRFRFGSDGSGQDEGWALDDIEVIAPTPPTVLTGGKSFLSMTGATLAGNITNNGNNTVTTSGVVVGTTLNPVRGGFGVTDSSTNPTVGTGVFNVTVGGLMSSTLYHYRAYAENGMGISYGADSTFTTASTPMTYMSSTTLQNNISKVSRGGVNNEVISMRVIMSPTGASVYTTQMNFDANGTTDTANISNFKVWYTGSSKNFATTTQFGSTLAKLPGGGSGTGFVITGNQALLNDTNYFWLTYDVSATSTLGNFIDGECSSITIDGFPNMPTVTAPTGNREIRAPYCVSAATTNYDEEIFNVSFGTLNNSSTCSTTGGTGSSLSPTPSTLSMYSNYTHLTPTNVVRGTNQNLFVTVNTCGGFYGEVVAAYADWNQNGTFEPTETLFSIAHTNGIAGAVGQAVSIPCSANLGVTMLRIVYIEGTSAPACGTYTYGETEDYAINVLENPAVYVGSTAFQQTGLVSPGASDRQVLRVPVKMTGCGVSVASDFRFNTIGSTNATNMIAAKLYRTGNSPVFNTNTLLGTVANPSGQFNFNVTDTLVSNDTTNYWLAYDISSSAVLGNVVDARIDSIMVLGTYRVPTNGNPAGNVQINSPMTYVSSTVEQPNTSKVEVGTTRNDIIRIKVVTSATGSAINATSFALSTNGSNNATTDIGNARVFYTGASAAFDTSALFGTAYTSPNGAFSVNGSQPLVNGDNYFWVAYNITSGAVLGDSVDAECSSITIGGIPQSPTVSAPAGSRAIRAPYCAATHTQANSSGDYISLVQLGTINNATGGAAALPNYTYFNTLSTNLYAGVQYSITVSAGTYTMNDMAAWIDFNGNGLFETSEKLGDVYDMGANPATATFTFTVPANAQFGTTRLRVRESDQSATMDPCAGYSWGETEDYNVAIVPLPTPTSYTWNQTAAASYATASNWTPSRTTLIPNDILVFPGSANLVVTNVPNQMIGGLTISGSANVTMSAAATSNLNVMSEINLGSGRISSTTVGFTLGTGIASKGSISGTGSIDAALTRWVDTLTGVYTFPLSAGAKKRTIGVAYTTNLTTGGKLTAQFVTGAPGSTGLPLTDGALSLVNISEAGVWNLSATNITGGTFDVTVTADSLKGMFNIYGSALVNRTGTSASWTAPGTAATPAGSNASVILSRSGLTAYNQFGIAGTSSNPLPVEMISFSGVNVKGDVKLHWVTASEINSKGFFVQRSVNGKDFEEVAFVYSKGQPNMMTEYRETDASAFAKTGVNTLYYRLRQIDLDGAESYSNTITVNEEEMNNDQINVYPNPFVGVTGVAVKTAGATVATSEILDLQGRVIAQETHHLVAGANYVNLNGFNGAADGIYFVRVNVGTITEVFRVQKGH